MALVFLVWGRTKCSLKVHSFLNLSKKLVKDFFYIEKHVGYI